jgi:hypothetical protein
LRLSSGHEAPLSDLLFDQDALERAIAAAVSSGSPATRSWWSNMRPNRFGRDCCVSAWR